MASNFTDQAKAVAVEMFQEFDDQIFRSFRNSEGQASDDVSFYDGMEEWHSETCHAGAYESHEACKLIGELHEYEETDQGSGFGHYFAWGLMSKRASLTFGNAVRAFFSELIGLFNVGANHQLRDSEWYIDEECGVNWEFVPDSWLRASSDAMCDAYRPMLELAGGKEFTFKFDVAGTFRQTVRIVMPGYHPEKVVQLIIEGKAATTLCGGEDAAIILLQPNEFGRDVVIARILDTDVEDHTEYSDYTLVAD